MDAATADALPGQFAQIGKFDHLVLALGSGKGVGPFATVGLADVKLGFEEKVYAHFATAQAALPFLNPTGSLTFVSAVSAHAAVPGTAGIGAANAAVAALVPILSVELKPLRVNGVSPGVIDTPWWDAVPDEQKQAMFKDFAAKTSGRSRGAPRGRCQGDRLFNWRRLHHRSHTDLRWWIALHGVSRPIARYQPPERYSLLK